MGKLTGKICIVTGATSGIGRETAKALAAEGATLVLPARNMNKAETLRQELLSGFPGCRVEAMFCELDSLDSVRAFALAFKNAYKELHLLINNAGIWDMKRAETRDGIERTIAVNHLAPFLMTHMLMDHLKAAGEARIITVSSEAHRMGRIRFDDLEGKKGWFHFTAYAQSKLANVLFTLKLSRMLEGSGVTANCLHPGVVSTHLFDRMPAFLLAISRLFMISPAKGARTSIFLALSDEVKGVSGRYFKNRRPSGLLPAARSIRNQDRLWDLSLEYCKNRIQA